ncbi:MAG: glycosyltransferase [Ruminococcus sp.]|nr:glycosyltransferase [Ruminococcus sp.]
MKKIKVLMVAGSMHVGGIENQLMHLLRNADKDKFQIDFTSDKPDAFYREEIEQLGGKFILIEKMSWKKPWKYCRAMHKIMKDGGYNVVHSHELFHSGITLAIAAKAGIPCRIAHAHNWSDSDGDDSKRGFVRTVYNKVMQLLINKYSTLQIACSTLAGKFLYGEKVLEGSTYHLMYNSVDTTNFLDLYNQVESGELCDDGWVNVVNVARINAVKNQEFLVRIAEELKKRDSKIRILCAGNGEEEYLGKIEKEIQEKQLEQYIKLLGVRKDIDVLMRKSSAFVLPSKYEGMPLVLIEAQASGLPCVVADTFSHEVDFGIDCVKWMQLEDGEIVWANAIEKAVATQRAQKKSVQAAIDKYGFDSKIFSEKLCDLYVKSLKSRR